MSLSGYSQASYDAYQDHVPTLTYSDANYGAINQLRPKVTYFSDLFESLVEGWRNETAFMSSPADMRNVESYKTIVGFEWMAVPFIIDEISRRPSLLLMALGDITGVDPISDSIRGNVDLMTGAWVAWYQKSKLAFI